MIARDLNVAAQLSLDHNLDTITLAGDRVDKKGALTGGYSDFGGRSRLQAQADIAATQDRFADLQKEIVAIKNELRSQTKTARITAFCTAGSRRRFEWHRNLTLLRCSSFFVCLCFRE